ncbi:PTS galactosamine transporter subunit IIC [Clostridium beijerinckii]|uniref:N-acetylgalactosamine permease IIC component 1 n=1 Tax=Clostridium beijerinckii TaxID=1520 RepID=A0A1S8SBQ9_CLOBE|nr:PTS galactosamine transporter subunit IIC [Clostridium beijerinckii]NRY61914.1 PTS system galactosamine-specific IIC component [Clostridium beijerinckii]OOM63000.1 N-acetylgalactosamine permease IIC component 1 [Clostridium beijerinckii]
METITLMQGIGLAIMAIIVGIDFWLEGLFIFRPIIVCTLTGIIIGDIQLGLLAGGLTELAFAGLTPAGGTQPPNPILAGVMTTVIAHTTGNDPAAAIGLALPFSFLMQYIILFFYSTFSVFMKRADKYADETDINKFIRLNIITTSIVAITYGIVVFLCSYVAQDAMRALVQSMPEWLTHGFGIAGGILPAVGFGMLLKVMLKGEFIPFIIIGFVVASFVPFSNLLPVAIVGVALALFVYNLDKDKMLLSANVNKNKGDDYSDGI